jgi:predicted nucleic acid-binding protein
LIVVDASALADMLIGVTDSADWARQTLAAEHALHAPDLVDYEVMSAFRRAALAGELGAAEGASALADYAALPVVRYPPLTARMWELRAVLTAYDAAYVALAEALDAPLVTTDLRLARAHGHQATVLAPAA